MNNLMHVIFILLKTCLQNKFLERNVGSNGAYMWIC